MRKLYAKAISVMVLLTLAAFCFTGCVRFRTSMNIKSNGKADLTVIYGYYNELIDSDVESEMEDLADAFEDDGWTVDEITEKLAGNTCGFKKTSCADQLTIAVNQALAEERGQ